LKEQKETDCYRSQKDGPNLQEIGGRYKRGKKENGERINKT
jgi:hypothetical protein